jgi:hypothetical protein
MRRMSVFSFFVVIVKKNFFELTKIFCFNVKETGLRAIVDSVIIIFRISNQDIVAKGCGKKQFRNTPVVNNPVDIIFRDYRFCTMQG